MTVIAFVQQYQQLAQPLQADPRSASRTSPETPLTSEDGADIALMRPVVNIVLICSHAVVM